MSNKLFKPDECDEDGTLLYTSWVHKQYEIEEEEDED